MAYYIDQSGKVEDTAKDTVVAIANGKSFTAKITAKTKRRLQERFRKYGLPRRYVLSTFTVLIKEVIESLDTNRTILVDTEYPGKNEEIVIYLNRLGGTNKIEFTLVGRSSKAHEKALKTYRGVLKPDIILSFQEVLTKIKKLESV